MNDISEHDITAQQRMFDLAMETYKERDRIRQGLWKKYAPKDQLIQAKIKIERCIQDMEVGDGKEVVSEGPDIMNYTAFAMRQVANNEHD
jgi:hypothetical protein